MSGQMTVDQVLGATKGEYVWVVEDSEHLDAVKREAVQHGWASRSASWMERGHRAPARVRFVRLTEFWPRAIVGRCLTGWCASCGVPQELRAELDWRVTS